MPDFSRRSDQEELMDDLQLEGPALAKNLHELELVNRYLGGNAVVLHALNQLLPRLRTLESPVQIADLGTGGGDLPRAIARWARKKGLPVVITGYDANPFMVDFSREHSQNFPEIHFEQADIFSKGFQENEFDLCISSLFCHHFSNERLISMLQQLQQQSRIAFIINDLHRHPLAYHSIRFLTWLFRGSHLVRNDAPLSVLRAFKKRELENLLAEAGIADTDVRWRWAFRYLVIGEGEAKPKR